MGFSRCLACNSEWNTCKTFVCTCTDFYTLNIATFNLVVDRVGFVGQVPDTPKDTDTPDTPSMVTKTSDSPKTGDNTNIYAYLAMLGLSCVGLGGMLYFKRRRKKS